MLTVSVHSWGTGISPFPGFIPVFPQTCPHSPPAAAEPKGAPRQLCRSNPQTFGMCSHINMHAHVYEYLAKAPKIHASTAPFISLGMKSDDCRCNLVLMQAQVNPQPSYIAPSHGQWPSSTADHKKDKREFRRTKGASACLSKKATVNKNENKDAELQTGRNQKMWKQKGEIERR